MTKFTGPLVLALTICQFLNSLPIASAGDLNEIPSPTHEIELHTGQRAPFPGLLMDMDQYRYYKTSELENDLLKKKVSIPPARADFVLGVGLGVVATWIICSLAKCQISLVK